MKIFQIRLKLQRGKHLQLKTLAVENIDDKHKYLTILFFSQHYTHLQWTLVQNITHRCQCVLERLRVTATNCDDIQSHGIVSSVLLLQLDQSKTSH